jgi:hypothetical protein
MTCLELKPLLITITSMSTITTPSMMVTIITIMTITIMTITVQRHPAPRNTILILNPRCAPMILTQTPTAWKAWIAATA